MAESIVDFSSLPWESPARGARFKALVRGGQRLRLVEFTPEFAEMDWCRKGHIGYLLEGELEIDFSGEIRRVRAGQGLFIAEGDAGKHKARALTEVARLILVERV